MVPHPLDGLCRLHHLSMMHSRKLRFNDKSFFSGPSSEIETVAFWEMIYQANASFILMLQESKPHEKVISFNCRIVTIMS